MMYPNDMLFRPYRKADLFNTAVALDTDFFATNVIADQDCLMRLCVSLSAGAIFRARITRGGVTITVDLNAGVALNANSVYAFDLPLKKGDELNLQVSAGVTVLYCSVDEIIYVA
jgi:hypothetical protein